MTQATVQSSTAGISGNTLTQSLANTLLRNLESASNHNKLPNWHFCCFSLILNFTQMYLRRFEELKKINKTSLVCIEQTGLDERIS